MPGPIVPSPAPTPRAIDLIALAVLSELALPWANGTRVLRSSPRRSIAAPLVYPSVFRRGRATEVDGGERGEDERLQSGDQHDLEGVEGDRHREGEDADGGE